MHCVESFVAKRLGLYPGPVSVSTLRPPANMGRPQGVANFRSGRYAL